MIGWHHRLNGQESDQISGDGERQGSPVCNPWGHKELDRQRLDSHNIVRS